MREITIWDIFNFRERAIEFNHISYGFDPAAKVPTPIDQHQRYAWEGRGWHPRQAYLVNGTVVEYPFAPGCVKPRASPAISHKAGE